MTLNELTELLLEFQFDYKTPKDKQELLYDFYILEAIRNYPSLPGSNWELRPNIDLQTTLNDATETLLYGLRDELLDATAFALAAELRHISDMFRDPDALERLMKSDKVYGDVLTDYAKEYNNLTGSMRLPTMDFSGKVKLSPAQRTLLKGSSKSYENSYKAIRNVVGDDIAKFVDVAEKVYELSGWSSSYGGKAWAGIARGWKHLNSTKEIRDTNKEIIDLFIWIDHVYSLQHNTDTVFNKIQSYYKAGYNWIKKSLDHKRDTNDPWTLWNKSSRGMKMIGQRVLAAKGYGSVEDFFKRTVDKKSERLDFGAPPKKTFTSDKLSGLTPLQAVLAGSTGYTPDKSSKANASVHGNLVWYKTTGMSAVYHNLYGPAFIDPNGGTDYYIDDKNMKPAEYWNHKDVKKANDGSQMTLDHQNKEILWKIIGGERHNINGPAIKSWNNQLEEWYVNGNLHRLDGPALTTAGGTKQFYVNGELFHKSADYWKHPDVMAYMKNKEKDDLLTPDPPVSATKSKKLTPDDYPGAELSADKESYKHVTSSGIEQWSNSKGQFHKTDGPAWMTKDGLEKQWAVDGEVHNLAGPAVLILNPDGTIDQEDYWINGQMLNKELWATHPDVIAYNKGKTSNSDEVSADGESFKSVSSDNSFTTWKDANGELHNTDGPAVISKKGSKHWYVHGKLHNLTGAAKNYATGAKLYYINGKKLSKQAWEKHPDVVAFNKEKAAPSKKLSKAEVTDKLIAAISLSDYAALSKSVKELIDSKSFEYDAMSVLKSLKGAKATYQSNGKSATLFTAYGKLVRLFMAIAKDFNSNFSTLFEDNPKWLEIFSKLLGTSEDNIPVKELAKELEKVKAPEHRARLLDMINYLASDLWGLILNTIPDIAKGKFLDNTTEDTAKEIATELYANNPKKAADIFITFSKHHALAKSENLVNGLVLTTQNDVPEESLKGFIVAIIDDIAPAYSKATTMHSIDFLDGLAEILWNSPLASLHSVTDVIEARQEELQELFIKNISN